MNGHGIGKFVLGMPAGRAAGAKAARHVSEAVDTLTEAMGM